MSSILNATTSSGLVTSADNSGSLQLATNNGTTAVTIGTDQRVAFVAGTAALPVITTTGDLNTGIFFPAADTIAFAEGGAEVMRLTSAGAVSFGSSGTAYGTSGQVLTSQGNATPTWTTLTVDGTAKAWVNFSGNGSTSINSSYNVSSVTYNSTGDYTINFTNALTDANYLPIGTGPSNSNTVAGGLGLVLKCSSPTASPALKSTTQCQMIFAGTGSNVNANNLSVVFFR